jgi:hypothetical protein
MTSAFYAGGATGLLVRARCSYERARAMPK